MINSNFNVEDQALKTFSNILLQDTFPQTGSWIRFLLLKKHCTKVLEPGARRRGGRLGRRRGADDPRRAAGGPVEVSPEPCQRMRRLGDQKRSNPPSGPTDRGSFFGDGIGERERVQPWAAVQSTDARFWPLVEFMGAGDVEMMKPRRDGRS